MKSIKDKSEMVLSMAMESTIIVTNQSILGSLEITCVGERVPWNMEIIINMKDFGKMI